MTWLSVRSKERLGGLIGDFAKVILAGYFAGEFFAHLSVLQKWLFWAVFALLIVLFMLLSVERGEER